MLKFLGAFTAAALLAAPLSAATFYDFSNGSFDSGTDTLTFTDVTTGVNLVISPINGTTLDSQTESRNGSVIDAFGGAGGEINLAGAPSGGVNTVDLRFAFVDGTSGAAVVQTDLEMGFYDLDGFTGEILTTITPVSAIVTTTTGLTTTVSGTSLQVEGVDEYNVPNVSDFSNLTPEQQNAAVLLQYGDRSFFDLRLTVTPDALNQRIFEFGNLDFTLPTTTITAPVPLPAPALMLGAALLGLGTLRARRA